MATTPFARSHSPSLARGASVGVVGGLAGGLLFGALMAMMGMLPIVAALVGSDSVVVGFGVHMLISAGAGLAFGLAAGAVPGLVATPVLAALAGAVYGIGWWIAGALIAMPMMLGMGEMVLAIGGDQIMSLVGHLVFGVTTGLVVFALLRREGSAA